MSSTVLAVEGMFHDTEVLTIERVLDDAHVDGDGRILVPIIDVLAILRIDVAAELLVVHHLGGEVRVLRVPDLVECAEMFLELQLDDACRTGRDTPWIVRLWPQLSDTSAPVTSLRATSFASFVGLT